MQTVLWVIAIVLVAVGVAGTVLPLLPGVPLVFAGLLLGAWIDGFQHVGAAPLLILGLLTVLSLAIDFAASTLGAAQAGAGRLAVAGAAVGAFVGLFFGLVGLIVGPFVGAALGQFFVSRDAASAGRVGLGAAAGLILGSLAKLFLALAMIGIFVAAWMI